MVLFSSLRVRSRESVEEGRRMSEAALSVAAEGGATEGKEVSGQRRRAL